MTTQDLIDLVENGVRESRQLEYKRDLPGSSDDDKKEFLADVTAFANTEGGVLVLGMDTIRDANGSDTGVPSAIPGVQCANLDKERQRLLSLLKDAVTPALLHRVDIKELESPSGGNPVLLVGIGASLERPHMVRFKGVTRFYRRSEAGKYSPDVPELRRMFLESASWANECEAFIRTRVKRLTKSSGIDLSSQTVVHVLPMARLKTMHNLRDKGEKQLSISFPPIENGGWNHRWNADGFMTFYSARNRLITSYTQCFRFAGVEAFTSRYIDKRDMGGEAPVKMLYAEQLTVNVENFVRTSIQAIQKVFDAEAPYYVAITLRGLAGAVVFSEGFPQGNEIEEDDLDLPAIILEHDSDVLAECRSVLEVVWQAAGYPGRPERSGSRARGG